MTENVSKKKYGVFLSILFVLIGYIIAGFGSILALFGLADLLEFIFPFLSYDQHQLIGFVLITVLILTLYHLFLTKRKRYNSLIQYINTGYVLFVCVLFTFCFVLAEASILDPFISIASIPVLPLFPLLVICSLFGSYNVMIVVGSTLIISLILITLLTKKYKFLLSSLICIGCAGICLMTYLNSPNYKYRNQNHGFTYMGGFSSTDLTDYTPYSNSSKLVTLDHEPEFMIEKKEDMPVMDGAEACYPVYSAVAKTLYKNIAEIEETYKNTSYDPCGEIVTFYNTAVGFERLVNGDVDLFFGAKPSASQLEYAKEKGVELEYTAIGKEAFVFFVEEDNPLNSLTSNQIRSIYHGELTNWNQVGGKNEPIIAFQRPERSGSQSMMVYFMGDVSLKEPLTHEMEYAMMGIVEEVVNYQNEAGAIGYSFRYFLEGLNEVENVKILSVDGIYPTNESIQDGSYPLIVNLYCISVKGNNNENVQKVIDFLLSEDGQTIIEQTGYSPLN